MVYKYGYYTCGNKIFTSKVDACIFATVAKTPLEWHFLDSAYDKFNWQQEPEESLDALYTRRARELREQYDYVILSYSGGSDSNNILESFIRNGIHLDEIVVNHLSKATDSTTLLDKSATSGWNIHAEFKLQILPRLQYIHDNAPTTRVTVMDMSDYVVKSFDTLFDDERWMLHRSEDISMAHPLRFNYLESGHIKKLFDEGKRVCVISGVDKPRSHIADNKFYVGLSDRPTNIATMREFNDIYTNVEVEFFYWAESTAPLICKQGHIMKRILENSSVELQNVWKRNDFASWLIKEPIIRDMIYSSTWDPSWFQAAKPNSWWTPDFEKWIHVDPTYSIAYEKWKKGRDFLTRAAGDYVRTINGAIDGLHTFEKNFSIGTFNPTKIS